MKSLAVVADGNVKAMGEGSGKLYSWYGSGEGRPSGWGCDPIREWLSHRMVPRQPGLGHCQCDAQE